MYCLHADKYSLVKIHIVLYELHATIFILHAFTNNRNFVSTYNKKK